MKIHLSHTSVGKNNNIVDYAKNARAFLIDNANTISFNHDLSQLLNTHDIVRTVMSDLYHKCNEAGKLDIFHFLDLSRISNIPSWFLISWLDIDVLELKEYDYSSYSALGSISAYRDKILVDITPYYSEKKNSISDSTNFYNRIVRNLLCRSYLNMDKIWISPNIIYYLTKFYSNILSSKIGRMYNLTYQEQYLVATALAVYFVNRCTDDTDVINPIMNKMDFLQQVVNTKDIYDFIRKKYTTVESYDMKAVIDVITEFGPSRISRFTESTFFTMNTGLSSNRLISAISLEYPPYWMFLILASMSGEKTNIYHLIKQLNMRKDIIGFQQELLRSSSFINSI